MSGHTFDAAGVCVHCRKDSMSGGLGGECHAAPVHEPQAGSIGLPLGEVLARYMGANILAWAEEFETSPVTIERWILGTTRPAPPIWARFIARISGQPANDLTPSEVALAKILAAWDGYEPMQGRGMDEEPPETFDPRDGAHLLIEALGGMLDEAGYVVCDGPTAEGRALLDRARKAGVL